MKNKINIKVGSAEARTRDPKKEYISLTTTLSIRKPISIKQKNIYLVITRKDLVDTR